MSETKILVEGEAYVTCPNCQSEFEQDVSIEIDPDDVKGAVRKKWVSSK